MVWVFLLLMMFVSADGSKYQNHERTDIPHYCPCLPRTRGGLHLYSYSLKSRCDWIVMTSDTDLLVSLQTVRDKDKAERKRKAEMARLRREKIMAQMSEMQKHFINENKELFQQSLEELEASTSTATYTHEENRCT